MAVGNSEFSEADVADFYDKMVFPSKTSHRAYEALVPTDLQGKRVGDFGCGQSLFQDVFERLEYDAVFLDIAPNVLSRIKYGEKVLGSLTDIPMEDAVMDNVFCIGVVHHIPDMEKALSEILRVIKPGGTLVLGVYAAGTVQARLRALHDGVPAGIMRKAVRGLSRILIWLKNRKNGLGFWDEDCSKRVDDLLITPVVRYVSTDVYAKMIDAHGGKIVSQDRISQMTILKISKT